MIFYFVATEPKIKEQTIAIVTLDIALKTCAFYNKYPLGPGEVSHVYQAEAVNICEVKEMDA